MKKRKAWLGPISAIAGIGSIAATVSCGGGGISRYDTENDGKLKITTAFSRTGAQLKTLNKIIDVFNNYASKHKKEGYMPIDKAVSISGGYGQPTNQLDKAFSAKQKKGLANMMFEYTDSAAKLRASRMELDLSTVLNKADAKAIRDTFDPTFFKQNDKIGGIKPGGIYSIPVGVSSMASAIDAPLFTYVIDEVNKKQAGSIDLTTSPKLKAIHDKGKASTGDITAIKNKWGGIDLTKLNADEKKALKVGDSVLDEWDTLIDFVSAVHKGFGIGVSDPERHLLALDSPTNIIQLLSYAYANGNMDDFYIKMNKNTGYVDWPFLKDKNSQGYKNFKKGVELLKKGVESGGLWIGGKGAYGSSYLINHNAMISIGSTAGVTHWFTGSDGTLSLKLHDANNKSINKEIADAIIVAIKNGSTGIAADPLSAKMKLIIKDADIKATETVIKDGTHWNKLVSSNAGKYDITLNTGVTATKLKSDMEGANYENKLFYAKANSAAATALNANTDVTAIAKSSKNVYYVAKTGKTPTKDAAWGKYDFGETEIKFKGDVEKAKATTFGSHNNKLLDKAAFVAKYDKYNVMYVDKMNDAEFLKLSKEGNGERGVLISLSNEHYNKMKVETGFDDIAKLIGTQADKKGNPLTDEDALKYLFVKYDKIQKNSTTDTLQAGEVVAEKTPTRVLAAKPTTLDATHPWNGATYVQGPSIIPVHANKAEDKATGLFVKWLTSNEEYVFEENGPKLTPLQYWLQGASYIPPLKGAFTNGSAIKTFIDGHKNEKNFKGTALAWSLFENKTGGTPGYIINPLIQPVDDYTAVARNSVTDGAIKSMYTSAHANHPKSFNQVYEMISDLARTNNVG